MTASALQVLARRVQAARERVRRNGIDPLLDLEYREAADNVRELYALRDLADELIDGEIIRARELDSPWDLLGSSRQQAQQRAARVRRRQRALTNHAHELRDSSIAVDAPPATPTSPQDGHRSPSSPTQGRRPSSPD